VENLLNVIKDYGAKITPPRKMVLEQLFKSSTPLTLKEIHNNCNNFDFASVYRTITLFKEIGLVEEINFADKKIRYELVSNLHHHHIICAECGEIKELPICFISEIKKITKYKITKHTLEFMGLCPNCQN
jgi:Fe2+ or Zn2+ uptake regulation protein